LVARSDFNGAILSLVMPGLVPGIHVLFFFVRQRRGWHQNSGLPEFCTHEMPQVG